MLGHMWRDCLDEDLDAEELKGFLRESDYPEKDSCRDKEEYYRQLQSWTDVWGKER